MATSEQEAQIIVRTQSIAVIAIHRMVFIIAPFKGINAIQQVSFNHQRGILRKGFIERAFRYST
jgi:hypothetical protein